MNKAQSKQYCTLTCVMLALVTFAAFEQVRNNNFVSYDDEAYVTRNQNVLAGLTLKNSVWAFTTFCQNNWHPLTWLSHMLDCQLFGLNPSYHHLMSLLLHIANTLLLFAVLNAMTSAIWRSAFVAAIFAIHPLHVESVAWVAERKDVLSTLFWMLTIAAYLRYVRRPDAGSYLLTLLVFALGLMAKPMLVTLPFVLLLLDYWPLGRLENILLAQASTQQTFCRLVREKIPFFILTIISSGITFIAQRSGGAVINLANLPVRFRLANAVLSYVKYIGKVFWPKDLVAFYSFKGGELTTAWVVLPLVFLLIASIRIIKLAPKYKYLSVGWFWYLGTLVPVIGIIQVGNQALADRYTYIPLIGLFVILAWGLDDFFTELRNRKIILGILALSVLSALTICTRHQVRYWQNSVALFEHALQVDKNNSTVHDLFATALAQHNRFDEALKHYRIALQMGQNPNSSMLYNMGCVYNNLGRYTEAIDAFKQAIRIKPDLAEAHNNLGSIYNVLGLYQEAIEAYKQAIRINPNDITAHYNLGATYLSIADKDAAMEQYKILKILDSKLAEQFSKIIK